MKNSKIKLPAKQTQTLYHFKNKEMKGITSSGTDTTTTCTTIITTTH